MSDTKWTPGPWSYGWENCNGLGGDVVSWQCFLDEEECHEIPIFSGNEAICVINYGDPYGPHKANAALMAAAPDLYGELAETHAALCFTEGYIGSLRYKRNNAALAKARGEHND